MTAINILAIDTATEACSAAVLKNARTYQQWELCPQQHSQQILPMVETVLTQAELDMDAINVLAFGRGPGSFTGVRIATGVIQGLALGSDKPVVGVSTLAAMAHASAGDKIAVAIDARMGEVYYAEYLRKDGYIQLQDEEAVLAPDVAMERAQAFAPDCLAGTGWQAYEVLSEPFATLDNSVLYPSADAMLILAARQFENEGGVHAREVKPIYLRDKVTWKKLPGKA